MDSRYIHPLTNSQRHSGVAITNTDRNPDTYAAWANTCAEPRGFDVKDKFSTKGERTWLVSQLR
jgi:hypothetical protein